MIDDREARLRLRLKEDFIFYAKKCLFVRDKVGKIARLELNKSQLYLHEKLEQQLKDTGMIRALVLKGRQQGVSTYTEARYYWRVTHRRGVRAFILTHEDAATQNLFEMASRYHANCPALVRPETGTSNAKELTFGKLDSGYKIGTAGTKAVGRSSTVQFFHGCLAEGTLVIDPTTDTLVPIEQYEVGRMVRTHKGNVAPVSFISVQEKECYSMKLRGYGKFPVVSSAEHKFWTPDGMKKQEELKVGDVLGFPVAEITGDKVLLPFRLPDEVRPQGGGSSESVTEIVVLNYDLGRLMGLYLAEGTIKLQVSGKYSGVCFSVHDREVPRTLEWLRSSFNLYSSVKVENTKGSNGSNVMVYGKSFAAFFDKMCGKVDTKHVPWDWRIYGKDFCRGMLHGYLSGDGSCSKERRRIVAPSTREAITLGMRDITASLGYGWASVGHHAAQIRFGRNEQEQFIYALCGVGADKLAAELGVVVNARTQEHNRGNYIKDGYAWVYINSISEAGLKTVYDFEVDHEDHSYTLLSCGSSNSELAFWPHADSHFSGVMQAIPHSDGTEVILESTANGASGKFYEMWQDAEKGKGEFIAVFMPWYWQEEYSVDPKGFVFSDKDRLLAKMHKLSDAQLAWRQLKIQELGEDLFRQEYPCLPASCKVGTNRGLISIADVRAGDLVNGNEVALQWCSGSKPVFRITTHMGYSFRATANHLVETESGEFVSVENLLDRKVVLAPPRFADKNPTVKWQTLPLVHKSIEVDADLGLFLGYFLGDGSYSHNTLSVVCDKQDTDSIAKVKELFGKFIGRCSTRVVGSKSGGVEIRVGATEAREALEVLGVLKSAKRVIKVPECIFQAPKRVVLQFLRGLFDSDGFAGLGTPRVSLFSKYRELLEGVQLLLLGFGITSRITSNLRRTGDYKYIANELVLRAESSILFAKEIGFISGRKNSRAKAWVLNSRAKRTELCDTVISIIADGEEPVYDLQMVGEPKFDANGVSVHNCTAQEAFLVSGRPAFDPKALMEAELECFSPAYRAEVIDGGRITRHENGALRVWDDPVAGKRYVIGCDVAEGLIHGDYSCAQVLSVPDGLQVAEWHGHVDPDRFGDILVSLGKRYNRAFIGVERNNHGLTTLTTMLHAGYANMYVQHDVEHRSGSKQTKKMGWLTTSKSKPKIIDRLASELRDGTHGICDKNLIDEMKRYQIADNGSYNAQDGYHDDRVMARAIAGEMVAHAPRNRLTETW